MTSFSREDELKAFLTKIDPLYAGYSSILYGKGVHDSRILGNAPLASLQDMGIMELHASDIIANCKATGIPFRNPHPLPTYTFPKDLGRLDLLHTKFLHIQ